MRRGCERRSDGGSYETHCAYLHPQTAGQGAGARREDSPARGPRSAIGEDCGAFGDRLLIDDSDEVCASYIAAELAAAPAGTLVIVDYLQLLDQNRKHPALNAQVRQLKAFARTRRVAVVCLSQIDRRYDPSRRPCPDLRDVRLPNPVDLGLFDRTCFLGQGRAQVGASGGGGPVDVKILLSACERSARALKCPMRLSVR